jgi:hypothetical protein
VKEQQKGLLPEGWSTSKKNIVLFQSSEDEYASVSEDWKLPFYSTQFEGLQQITRDMAKYAGQFHLYIRVHPNMKEAIPAERERINQLQGGNVSVIPAESPISTYALMHNADKVISFGSTVGIEATYWGKPSILAGKCFYVNLGGTYNPATHQELMELILTEDLPPKDKEAALKYAYYINSFGIPFVYYKAEGFIEGKFNGRRLEPARNYRKMMDLLQHPRVVPYEKRINVLHRKWTRRKFLN